MLIHSRRPRLTTIHRTEVLPMTVGQTVDESKIYIPGQQRTDIPALADRRRHLPTDADLLKSRPQQAGHPLDVGYLTVHVIPEKWRP